MGSVDKFGRWGSSNVMGVGGSSNGNSSRGPPGVGFKLTPNGHYDMSKKRLVNAGKARNLADVVILEQLQALEKQCLKLSSSGSEFDVQGKPIINLPDTKDNEDLVKLVHLKRFCLMSNGKSGEENIFDVKKGKLINSRELPTEPYDVVNKAYVDSTTPTYQNEGWDFKSRRIINATDPIYLSDGATKGYVDKKIVDSQQFNIEFVKNKTSFFHETNELDMQSTKRIINLVDPIHLSDACTVNYLIRLLSKMFFSFYSSLTPNSAAFRLAMTVPGAEDEWIRINVIEPFFISPVEPFKLREK